MSEGSGLLLRRSSSPSISRKDAGPGASDVKEMQELSWKLQEVANCFPFDLKVMIVHQVILSFLIGKPGRNLVFQRVLFAHLFYKHLWYFRTLMKCFATYYRAQSIL